MEPDPSFIKKAWHHGRTRRLIRLGGDWALLKRNDTLAAVPRGGSEASLRVLFRVFFRVSGSV